MSKFIPQKSKSMISSAVKLSAVTSILICVLWVVPQAKADDYDKIVYLSDVSRHDVSPTLSKLLIDAKRRTFTFGKPIYQCDHSVADDKGGKPDTHGIIQSAAIVINGKIYKKGVGTGTPFVLTYNLAGKFSRFTAIAGTEELEENPQDWIFDVYLDDVKAASYNITKEKPAMVDLDMTDVQELVLVGSGPDLMMVNLANAQLIRTDKATKPGKASPTNRKAILEMDDDLVIKSQVFLTARSAKKIDSQIGPDESAVNLGGYGRTTSTRGADMWAGIKDKGDLLRWQTFIRKPGSYRVLTRIVSSEPGKKPNPEDYIVRIDGKELSCRPSQQTIVERMTDEKFTGHLWGYIQTNTFLDEGLHTVEVENKSGNFLAVNRVVMLLRRPARDSEQSKSPPKPIAAKHKIKISKRWEPKPFAGQHFVSTDMSDPFDYAQPVDLMFAPTLTGFGANFHNADDESIKKMLEYKLPFTIHVRFNTPLTSPPVGKETYERIKDLAGDLWQGFWTTEWSDCYNFFQGEFADIKPKNRKEAYEKVKAWYQQKASMCHNDILPMCTSWRWDHYAGEWSGATGFQDEPGISPTNQLRILFPRGAARQYQKYWHTYIAPGAHDAHTWIQNGYMTKGHPHNTRQNQHGGSSMSWVKRTMYQTYMWGTNSLKNETPAYLTDMTPSGKLALSPMGKVAADFYEFAATKKDRGICYTPVGIMLDFMHGWGNRGLYPDAYPTLTWGCLQQEPSDYMKDALFETIYPGQFDELNEWNLLSSTPYGDIFDVMLSSASAEHIADYPVLVLIGDVALDMDKNLAKKLETYVKKGGTLVINAEQVTDSFPKKLLGVKITDKTSQADSVKCNLDNREIKGQTFSYRVVKLKGAKSIISTTDKKPLVTRNKVGKGVVILTTVPFMLQENLNGVCFLPHLTEHLTSGLLPFQVDGEVEYIANRNENSWLVTVMNNRGIYKMATEPTFTDKKQKQTINITLNKKPGKLADWISGKEMTANKLGKKWQITVDIPPGDLKIIQIQD